MLDAARKFAQKGAKEKALKEYNTLLKVDPRDAKLLLEIGDAYRRWGEMEEAVNQYTRVAEQYKTDGFDARAVAVYKQILNIDSKRYPAHVALSEVYQRMGLESEAVAALQAAADGYRQEGNKREALDLLRRMAQLDPTNTTSRLKVAELLQQEGMEDDALAEYDAVVEELKRSGATDQLAPLYERILELQPSRGDLLLALAQLHLEAGDPGHAEPFARRALEIDAAQTELHELLCEIYKALDRPDELEEATRTLAQIYRDRGDENEARQIMQRLPGHSELDVDTSEVEEPLAPAGAAADDLDLDDELLDDDDFLVGDDDDFEEAAGEPAPPVPVPEGDPDQLFAEASVYLRYGKRDQAVASLEAILLQEPGHRDALDKLGEAHADAGDDARAVEVWSRAADVAREQGDASGFEILRDRISALDPAAGSALGPAPSGADDAAVEVENDEVALDDAFDDFDVDDEVETADDDGDEDFDFDVDVDDDLGLDGDAADEDLSLDDVDVDVEAPARLDANASTDAGIEIEEAGPDLTGDVEVDLDDLEFGDEEPGEEDDLAFGDEDDADEDDEELEFGDDVTADDEIDEAGVDLDDLEFDVDLEEDAEDAGEEPAAVTGSTAGQSSTMAQEIQDELDEAEFYFGQELFDEAKALYERVLEKAPNHPSAMLRLGEIEAQQGEDPNGAGSGADLDVDEDAPIAEAAQEPADDDEEEGDFEFEFGDDAEDEDEDDEDGLSLDAALAAAESAVGDEDAEDEDLAFGADEDALGIADEADEADDDEGDFDFGSDDDDTTAEAIDVGADASDPADETAEGLEIGLEDDDDLAAALADAADAVDVETELPDLAAEAADAPATSDEPDEEEELSFVEEPALADDDEDDDSAEAVTAASERVGEDTTEVVEAGGEPPATAEVTQPISEVGVEIDLATEDSSEEVRELSEDEAADGGFDLGRVHEGTSPLSFSGCPRKLSTAVLWRGREGGVCVTFPKPGGSSRFSETKVLNFRGCVRVAVRRCSRDSSWRVRRTRDISHPCLCLPDLSSRRL